MNEDNRAPPDDDGWRVLAVAVVALLLTFLIGFAAGWLARG